MYFMAMGLFVKGSEAVVSASNIAPEALGAVNVGGYLHNLIPVTIGNMVGGILFVAGMYFLVYKEKLESFD
jgi:formate/nitrite transporter FocA (FNT family)